MIFTTPTQYVILGLLVFIGWLFGLASHPGGGRWKRALQDEELSNAAYRDQAETRARDDKKRIAELERSNESLQRDLEAGSSRPAAATAVPVVAAAPEPEKKSWIGWGSSSNDGDDLTKIRGIDANGAAKLNEQGIKSYRDITGLSHEDEMALEQRVGAPAGTIQRDQWRDQAELLADQKIEEHRARFWG